MKKLFLLLLLVPLLLVTFAVIQSYKGPEPIQQTEYMSRTMHSESNYFTATLIIKDGWIVSLEVCDKFEGECEIGDEPNHTEYDRITWADYDSLRDELALFLKYMDALHEELGGE